ncbi:hypothetical protein BC629DRAFT_268168 [Irpex lacteus]|nr:hypothetical protein BC629DRAFT_268168 [Irpex lacteus]
MALSIYIILACLRSGPFFTNVRTGFSSAVVTLHTMGNDTINAYDRIIIDNIVGYTVIAFAALLVYDVLICLSDEIALVWSRASRPRSWIYIINRYFPFIDMGLYVRISRALVTEKPTGLDLRHFKVATWIGFVGVLISEGILMQRTYAIFGCRRWMFGFLCCLMATVALPASAMVKCQLDNIQVHPSTYTTIKTLPVMVAVLPYTLILLSETVIFSFTLYKAVKDLRFYRSPLIVNLYRNGLICYAYVLVISLANVTVLFIRSGNFANSLAIPQRIFHSIFCARILLSILRDGNVNSTQGTSLLTGSSMVFRAPTDSEISAAGRTLEHSSTSRNVEGPDRSASPGMEERNYLHSDLTAQELL